MFVSVCVCVCVMMSCHSSDLKSEGLLESFLTLPLTVQCSSCHYFGVRFSQYCKKKKKKKILKYIKGLFPVPIHPQKWLIILFFVVVFAVLTLITICYQADMLVLSAYFVTMLFLHWPTWRLMKAVAAKTRLLRTCSLQLCVRKLHKQLQILLLRLYWIPK